jgi:hypothetical protein
MIETEIKLLTALRSCDLPVVRDLILDHYFEPDAIHLLNVLQGKAVQDSEITFQNKHILNLALLLVQEGANVNHTFPGGKTFLHYINHPLLVCFFIQQGLDPNQLDDDGYPPLYYALNKPEIVKHLCMHGADPYILIKLPTNKRRVSLIGYASREGMRLAMFHMHKYFNKSGPIEQIIYHDNQNSIAIQSFSW